MIKTDTNIRAPKKLIEVALPLDTINTAAALEKQPFTRRHPRSLHIWWARRPLTAARAVIFSQMVNDPSWKWEMEHPGQVPPTHLKASWAASRKRLFAIIEDLVKWENTTNETVLEKARTEIRKSWREVCELNQDHPQADDLFNPDVLPGLHDPFAGGGAIPLEAQRLGLAAYASDLNPVAVLINKAMIEIPPRFAGRSPVGPVPKGTPGRTTTSWPGATGLAEDVRRYGTWMREEAVKRIGHLYPPVEITREMASDRPDLQGLVGRKLTVIAWLWARTVKSPSPAFSQVEVPLVSNFIISSKAGKEAYVHPVVKGDSYRFSVRIGVPPAVAKEGTKAVGRGANFRCLVSDAPISGDYIKAEGQAGRLGVKLMAIVVEGNRGRLYLEPTSQLEAVAAKAVPSWKPSGNVPARLTGGTCVPYGLKEWGDLFTPRQLVALTTFSDLVAEVREKVYRDALALGFADENKDVDLDQEGHFALAYADAVSLYFGLMISRWTDLNNSLCTWNNTNLNIRALFSRQAIPMTWDFVELSAFGPIAGFDSLIDSYLALFQSFPASSYCFALQADAQSQHISASKIISTDPPYYDNIGYADLSDFFYVWLRKILKPLLPDIFVTVTVPKGEELVASPHRHGSKEKAESFFLNGMTHALHSLAEQSHPTYPVTIYYAFKSTETKAEIGTSSTGWETFLGAVLKAGFALTGTWPIRTEREGRMIGLGSNALASSIVLVCRKRPADAPTISRRQFQRELNAILPEALDEMTKGGGDDRSPVAPVDLSQAIIGPGMAVFSKYAAVLEADGTPMSVKTALLLINRFLAEDDFDADTQFCLHWFEQNGWKEGSFGDADTLSRAKGTSVAGVCNAGVIESGGGIVRLRKWSEYPSDWDPGSDSRLPVWEALHQLIRALREGGEAASGALLTSMIDKTEAIRQLSYRLYTLCERQGWAEDARAYNELITSWSGIEAAVVVPEPKAEQLNLFH